MTTRPASKPWDFTHVLELVDSLSSKDQQHETGLSEHPHSQHPTNHDQIDVQDFSTPAKLGDFGRIWQYLGSPLDSPAPIVPPLLDYTSDGATYFASTAKSRKEVTWRDEAEASAAEEPDTVTDDSVSPESPTLTKAQRKKQRRRERKAQETAKALKDATVSESEADNVRRLKTPARKASTHSFNVPAPPIAPKPASVTPLATPRSENGLPAVQSKSTSNQNRITPSHVSAAQAITEDPIKEATARVTQKLAELKQTPSAKSKQQHFPISASTVTPTRSTALMVPSSVQPSQSTAISITTTTAPTRRPNKFVIEPKTVRSGEDRNWALLMKLIGDFWEDRKHLIAPMNLTTHNNNPDGIHVFVDASNIFIGFTDQLKRSRNIPQYAQVPQVGLSFDALGLLMERRRPVAKRVLVGSTPHLPAFDKAKAVGYECSILEKVYKARELTERQIYFQELDKQRKPWLRTNAKALAATNNGLPASSSPNNYPPSRGGNGAIAATISSSLGAGSGSDTTTVQHAPARMIEQGVDEILHLKMLESIVDSGSPSTIVLATGDAAQAEYSPGFMAMVERALKKGWRVELVSWSKNISGMYKKREWAEAWGERFRVIYLDDYAEELLEM